VLKLESLNTIRMAGATTKTFRFLTSAQVIKLHSSLIYNAKPTQPTLLDSAVASPMNIKHYEKEENIFQLAASLSEKIMKNHAYQDGNKRTALVAADMFLKINGYEIQRKPMAHDAVNDGIVDAIVLVATSQWDAKKLGEYYKSIAKPVEEWSADRTHHYSTG
jgi:death-on-curing family protein